MSSEARTISLAEAVCSANTGLDAIKRAPIVGHDTGIRCLRIQDVSQSKAYVDWGFTEVSDANLAKFRLRKNEILIARTGNTIGVNKFIDEDVNSVFNNGLIRLRVDENFHVPKYVYYLLQTDSFRQHINAIAHSTSTQPNMKIRNFLEFKFLALQKIHEAEIVQILSALDDRIALLRETNATLEAIAQALFKSWFVDFDPVHAKAQGIAPEGLDEATATLFPDSFEESELGLVPRGWKLVPFGSLLIHTIGGDWGDESQNEKNDVRVAIIRGTDIPDLQSGANSRVPIRYTSQKKLSTRKLEDGDIVLEVSGGSKDQPTGRALYLTVGMLGQFDCPVEPASFCRLLRPKTKEIGLLLGQHLTYIYAQGKTWEYQNQSTGIANFQTAHFLDTELVAVPSDDVLAAFAEIIHPMIERAHLTQMQTLATLRDTLLPRLISGQLRLPEAEEILEETMV